MLVSFAFMPQTALAVDGVTVHGIVTDADEEPLIGVSILQEGTKNGVATNIDGEYSITVPVGVSCNSPTSARNLTKLQ